MFTKISNVFCGQAEFIFTSPRVMKATKLWSGKACAFITLHGTEEYVLVTFVGMVCFAIDVIVHALHGQVVVLCDWLWSDYIRMFDDFSIVCF